MTRVKLAVIGVGALGQHHARILSGMSDVELVGVVDARESQGRMVAEKHGTRLVCSRCRCAAAGGRSDCGGADGAAR